jgi:hypothetical protein
MNLPQQLPSRFIKCFKWWGSNEPEDALVNITIYDMMGRVVRTLVNIEQTVGFKSIQAGEFKQTKKMVLLK